MIRYNSYHLKKLVSILKKNQPLLLNSLSTTLNKKCLLACLNLYQSEYYQSLQLTSTRATKTCVEELQNYLQAWPRKAS